MKERQFMFATIALILGGMLAIQFETTNNPVVRDTRDLWELRADLEKEKQRQQELNEEFERYSELLNQYKGEGKDEKIQAMEKALWDLKKQAGLTTISGQGIVITIEPFSEELIGVGQPVPKIDPDMLRRLVNELNRYDANEISIDGQRVVSKTPIREVNGNIYINNEPVSSFPIEIRVLAKDNEKLHQKIIASPAVEEFIRENFLVESKQTAKVILPAFDKDMKVKFMKPAKEET
ncbi:DUF881 domain-containing protein [Fictibacillus norfolkensis]|uniref:DUF881 domain-containing protein n=1 Tax=Fictibacillus norfolkensis TaxID=2762233 RepID=A0ABR8SMN6_9BACL|nr:DUF881 domain-containing protein [Fictibacillus norfolkensis]MBD7964379.1 DUF881 domain-containing protein [Fictibacillus norfolkensis]